MGQAKLRGDYQQRKEEAEARNAAEAAAREQHIRQQRKEEAEARLAAMLAIAAASGVKF